MNLTLDLTLLFTVSFTLNLTSNFVLNFEFLISHYTSSIEFQVSNFELRVSPRERHSPRSFLKPPSPLSFKVHQNPRARKKPPPKKNKPAYASSPSAKTPESARIMVYCDS